MGIRFGYSREETVRHVKTGKMRCVIVGAETAVSKSGKNMIVITVTPSGSKAKVKHFIVEGAYFNRNMTQFLDAFPMIQPDWDNIETSMMEWVGCEGGANFGEDDQGWLKVKWWLLPDEVSSLPPFEGDKPQRVEVNSLDAEAEETEEDLPFDLG